MATALPSRPTSPYDAVMKRWTPSATSIRRGAGRWWSDAPGARSNTNSEHRVARRIVVKTKGFAGEFPGHSSHVAAVLKLRPSGTKETDQMARVDEIAAKIEVEKAESCRQQADQLTEVANELRKLARHHLHEAEELRGRKRKRS